MSHGLEYWSQSRWIAVSIAWPGIACIYTVKNTLAPRCTKRWWLRNLLYSSTTTFYFSYLLCPLYVKPNMGNIEIYIFEPPKEVSELGRWKLKSRVCIFVYKFVFSRVCMCARLCVYVCVCVATVFPNIAWQPMLMRLCSSNIGILP